MIFRYGKKLHVFIPAATKEDIKRGRPFLAKLLRDHTRMEKLLTPPIPPPIERKHQPSKSSKSEKDTKDLFESPRDSQIDPDSEDSHEEDDEEDLPPTAVKRVDDAIGWRYIAKSICLRLQYKHWINFQKTAEYEALKKNLDFKWSPKRNSTSERERASRHSSRRPSRNSLQRTSDLGVSPSPSGTGVSPLIGVGSDVGGKLIGLKTPEPGDGKEKEKEKDIKEKDIKEPPDRKGLMNEEKGFEPFDSSTIQLYVEYLRKSGKDKETVVKRTYKLPKNRDQIGIGRASSNTVRLPDAGVSRTHGRIEWKSKTLIYVDLGSAYGTKLNGESIKRAILQTGDVLKMGKSATIEVQLRVKSKSKLSMCNVM